MRLGHRGIGFELRDEHVVGVRLLPREIDEEGKQRNEAHDGDVVGGRANFPELSPIHKFSTHHVGTAAFGRSVEQSSTVSKPPQNCVELRSTDSRGRLSLHKPVHSPAAFGPLRGLSASSVSMTGAGPEMPPSFLTRQKCTIISTEATIGMPMQCQMYDRSNALASTIEPPSSPKRTSL